MIEFKKAKKDYKNINMDLSLHINKGEILLLVGKNAAGKTSSLKLLLGVNELDYGTIEIDGENIQKVDKEKFGLVLQDSFFPLDFTANQVANVLKNTYRKFDKNLFYKYLEEFDLPVNERLKNYSLGMLAKIKIISAVCHDPEIIVLDEPTLGLDLLSRDQISELLRSIMDDNKSMIISSHMTNEFEKLCDRVVFINDGQIIGQYEMDFVDSSLAKIKGDVNDLKRIEKDDILSIYNQEFVTTYLIKNRQKYMDGKWIMEKADLDDLVRAVYKRSEKWRVY